MGRSGRLRAAEPDPEGDAFPGDGGLRQGGAAPRGADVDDGCTPRARDRHVHRRHGDGPRRGASEPRRGLTIDADETVGSVARRQFDVSPTAQRLSCNSATRGEIVITLGGPFDLVRGVIVADNSCGSAAVQSVRDQRRDRPCARIRRALRSPRTRHVRLTVGAGLLLIGAQAPPRANRLASAWAATALS